MQKIYKICLKDKERQQLHDLVNKGRNSARKIKRANILILSDQGKTDKEISEVIGVSTITIEKIRKRFIVCGMQLALNDKPRPGRPVKIDGKTEAILIALACSSPPEGRRTWTMELLANELIIRNLVDNISDEAVRLRLKKAKLNRGNIVNGV